MASTFPNQVDVFTRMLDITASDGSLIQQYQAAMQAGNLTAAQEILAQIPRAQQKIVTADYLNQFSDAIEAVEKYFLNRYSPAYVVSAEQPAGQEATDFWFQVIT